MTTTKMTSPQPDRLSYIENLAEVNRTTTTDLGLRAEQLLQEVTTYQPIFEAMHSEIKEAQSGNRRLIDHFLKTEENQ